MDSASGVMIPPVLIWGAAYCCAGANAKLPARTQPECGKHEMRKLRIRLFILVGVLLALLVSLLPTIRVRKGGAVNPQYVGAWLLMHSDGTTEKVWFNGDGTISANDDYVYRWAGDEGAVRIVAYEKVAVSMDKPISVLKYLYPHKSKVILTPRIAEESSDVMLVGNGVTLRQLQDAE